MDAISPRRPIAFARAVRSVAMFLLSLWTVGCASILNGDDVSVTVHTRPSGAIMHVAGDSTTYTTSTIILAHRSPDDLILDFTLDSLHKQVVVPAELSGTYWLNIYPVFWPGFFVDLKSNRRFTYASELYIDLLDSSNTYYTWNVFEEPEKFRWAVWLSFLGMPTPDITSQVYEINGERISKGSINGAGGMLLFSPAPTELLIISAEARTTVIGECFGDCYGDERSTVSGALLWGRQWLTSWLTAGLHGTFSAVTRRYGVPGMQDWNVDVTRTTELGPALNSALRLGEDFWVVLGYQPSLFEFDRLKVIYTHQLSLSLRAVL